MVCMSVILITSASQTKMLVVEQSLNQYWRTTYDILVRPSGSRSPIEEKYGLIEANQLSGIWGGITFDQFNVIKSIPGVQVAAPIAMVGYISSSASTGDIQLPNKPGLYILEEIVTINDGAHSYNPPDFPRYSYYFFDRDPQVPPSDPYSYYRQEDNINFNWPGTSLGGYVQFPFLVAGIDPIQEAALVGLDKAVVSGIYLQEYESLTPTITMAPSPPKPLINLPILINTTNYVNLTHKSVLMQALLPPDVATESQILAKGGTSYLKSLPAHMLATLETDSHAIYQQMFADIAPQFVGVAAPLGPPVIQGVGGMDSPPGPISYRQAQSVPDNYAGIVLDLVPPDNSPGNCCLKYRTSLGKVEFQSIFIWDPKGIFDIERLPKQGDINRVPLETYFPPIATLIYDERGDPLNPPIKLSPTLDPASYIQSPPMVLTTIAAARTMRGDAAISAIRIRVALDDCPIEQPTSCSITPSAVRKIETIAIEIQRRTGLNVDIMVGSSPKRILVHVPGIGYVEEQWVQKGVNLIYKQGIQMGNWLLLGTLLVFGGFFTLNITWTDVVAGRRVIALQKALGWRSSSVFALILGQALLIGIIAIILGTLLAVSITWLMNWSWPSVYLLVELPLIILGITTLGSLIPSWSASRTRPIIGLQQGGLHYQRKGGRLNFGLWGYAWKEILRRPWRSVLAGIPAVLSAFLLVILLGVVRDQQGLLSGTLLGEFILLHVEGYHYAILGIGVGLAALSTTNGLLASIIERRREIAILMALGWRKNATALVFVLEGTLLGLVGGILGAILGGIFFVYFYHVLSINLLFAVLSSIGILGFIGALSAVYPGILATRILPAEAVRYE